MKFHFYPYHKYSNILNTKGNTTSFSIQNIAIKTISKPNAHWD